MLQTCLTTTRGINHKYIVVELLREEEIEEVFRYLEIYRNSLGDDKEIEDAEELIRYYENKREGLLAYQS